jgi:uncharacterized protein (DUF697 family)
MKMAVPLPVNVLLSIRYVDVVRPPLSTMHVIAPLQMKLVIRCSQLFPAFILKNDATVTVNAPRPLIVTHFVADMVTLPLDAVPDATKIVSPLVAAVMQA